MKSLELSKLDYLLLHHYSINESNAILRAITDNKKSVASMREILYKIDSWNKDESLFNSEEEYIDYLEGL